MTLTLTLTRGRVDLLDELRIQGHLFVEGGDAGVEVHALGDRVLEAGEHGAGVELLGVAVEADHACGEGEDGMLFHDISGPQYPEPCAMPDPTQSQRRLGEGSLISYEAAAKACLFAEPLDLEDCIADVLATGDPEMAGAF